MVGALAACSAAGPIAAPRAGPVPAKLVVETTQGAAVFVDGVQVGNAPLPAPVEAEGGEHHVAVTLDGHHPFEQLVELRRGAQHVVAAELSETTQRKWAWAAMGVGGAGVATGIALGVLSIVEHRAAQDLDVDDDQASDADRLAYDDAIAARDRYRIASGATAAAGVALFLTGAILFAFDAPDVPAPPRRSTPQARASFTPWLAPGLLGGAARIDH